MAGPTATATQASTTGRAPSTTVNVPSTGTVKKTTTPKATRGQAFTTTRPGQQQPRSTQPQDDVTEPSSASASSGLSQAATIEVIVFVIAGTLVALVILVLVARRSKRRPRTTFSNGPNAHVNPTYGQQPLQTGAMHPHTLDPIATGSDVLTAGPGFEPVASPFNVAPARGPVSPFEVVPARAAAVGPGQHLDQDQFDQVEEMRGRKTTVWAKPAPASSPEPAFEEGDHSEL